MTIDSALSVLRSAGLRDTAPRRAVLEALSSSRRPMSPADIAASTKQSGSSVNLVTVYRVLDAVTPLGVVHQHPCSGRFALCQLDSPSGHHGFLHCHDCGGAEEFLSDELCAIEHAIALRSGFHSSGHIAEITGTCRQCRS